MGGYHNRENSLILSATIDGRRIETVEVSLKTFEAVSYTHLDVYKRQGVYGLVSDSSLQASDYQ